MGSPVAAFSRGYPADLRDGGGITFDKRGLSASARLDYRSIAPTPLPPTDGLVAVQDPVTGALYRFDLGSLPFSPAFFISLLSGPVPEGYPPRRSQFLGALEASEAGRVATLRASIPSDPGDPVAIAWEHTLFISAGGTLAQFVKGLFGLSTDDLNTLLRQARTRSE